MEGGKAEEEVVAITETMEEKKREREREDEWREAREEKRKH